MAMPLDQFSKALVASGLFAPDDVKRAWDEMPADARPKDGEGFAARLVERGRLTPFQAQSLLAGRGAALLMGEYVILDRIGAGGMGQVYKARHRRMQRIVALKVMSQQAMKDESAVKRFEREVVAAARLAHPNIVTAFDSGSQRGVHFLVMEYVEGHDLSTRVKRDGPLPVETAVEYIVQAARGLAFAHQKGVIHRDIKPANLLVDQEGAVKILDMGLARFEDGTDALTATEQVMGTVDYMSPEQATDTKHADARADIYSLGCTFWYLLTGKKLYEGDSLVGRMLKHREEPIPNLMQQRDDVPWAVEQVFRKMVAKQLADRYQTMTDVIRDLERARGGGGPASGIHAGGEGPADASLQSFLAGIGQDAGRSGVGGKSAASKSGVLGKSGSTSTRVTPADDATAAFARPEADTDPQSVILPTGGRPTRSGTGPRGAPGQRPAPQTHPRRPSRLPLVAGGVAALVALTALGVWVIVRDPQGNEVARIQVPAGGTVTVSGSPPAATPSTAAASPSAAPPSTAAGNWALDFSKRLPKGAAFVRLPIALDLRKPLTVETFATIRSLADERQSRPLIHMSGHMELKQHGKAVTWTADGKPPNYVTGDAGPLLNRRVHLAGVSTGQELRLFIDGRQVGTVPLTVSLPPNLRPVILGYGPVLDAVESGPGYAPLDGTLEQVRISGSARYGKDFTPPARLATDNDTLALYEMLEGQGTTLRDTSGHEHHGEIGGATWVRVPAPAAPPPAVAPRVLPQSAVGAAWILEGHTSVVRDVAISPDGRHAYTASWDATWRRWNLETGAEVARVDADQTGINCLALSPDGKTLVTGASNFLVKEFDAATGVERRKHFVRDHAAFLRVAFRPTGDAFVGTSQPGAVFGFTPDDAPPRVFAGSTVGGYALDWLPDGSRFVTAAYDKSLRFWDWATGQQDGPPVELPKGGGAVAVAPDGKTLAVSGGRFLSLYDVATRKEIGTFDVPTTAIGDLEFLPGGVYLAAGCEDKTLRLYHVGRRDEVHRFTAPSYVTHNLAVAPDGRRIVSGGGYRVVTKLEPDEDYRVYVWDVPEAYWPK